MFSHQIIGPDEQKQIDAAIDAALSAGNRQIQQPSVTKEKTVTDAALSGAAHQIQETSEPKEKSVTDAARDIVREYIELRVYRAPREPGDLVIDVQHPILDGDGRYDEHSHAARHLRDRGLPHPPGVPGQWLEFTSTPTPLRQALKLILDPHGPEAELRRRRRIVRNERRALAAE